MEQLALVPLAALVLFVSFRPYAPGNDIDPKTGKNHTRSRWSE